MQFILDLIERRGGLAYTRELSRVPRNVLDVAAMYGTVLHVKKGLWALPTIDPQVVKAHRSGGRLACVSALVYHGVIEPGHDLHICAPHGVTSWRPRGSRVGVIRHWSRRPVAGDRFAVSVEVAWAQFALCRAVAGRDVRLRQRDSL
ncbi:MAG: hypothetical protein ABI566_09025 [Pseudolysinimonas sp.]